MILVTDEGGGLGSVAKKLILLGVVVVGVPIVALGLGAMMARRQEKRRSEKEDQDSAAKAAAPTAPAAPTPPPAPPVAPEAPPAAPVAPEAPPAAPVAPEAPPAAPVASEAPPAAPAASEAPPAAPAASEAPPAAPAASEAPPAPMYSVPQPLAPTGTAPAESASDGDELRTAILEALQMLEAGRGQAESDSQGPSLEDRRQAVRFKVEVPVICSQAGEEFAAQVVDLSLSGLRLRSNRALEVGEHWSLVRPSDQENPVRARVVWCLSGADSARLGMEFADTPERILASWAGQALIRAGLSKSQLKQQRKWIRVPSDAAVTLRDKEDAEHHGKLVNLGAGGALVVTQQQFKAGDSIRLVVATTTKKGSITLNSDVVACRAGAEGFDLHLKFKALAKGAQKRLDAYILELLKSTES